VPDGDRLERSFAPGWRKIYRLAKGGCSSEAELADACLTALAHYFRQSGGCPGLRDIANVLHSFIPDQAALLLPSEAGGSTLSGAFEALRRIERQQGGHRTTRVAVRTAMSMLAHSSREERLHDSDAELTLALAEQTCLGLVDHHFFGRARAYLVGEQFSSFHEARAWKQAVKKAMSLGVQELAARLLKDPSAAHLRAPKRSVARRSTRDILKESLTK
jgi:hypothetical protein